LEVLFIWAIYILWKSHSAIGKFWTATIGITHEHKLITSGIYKYIRHPMYSAHILWAIAQIMILHNWIAGYSFIIFILPHFFFRIKNEEKMLIEYFGEEYIEYKRTSKKIIPGVF